MKKSDLVKITTQTKYIPEESEPSNQKFIWSYEITIENNTDHIIQLLNRFWRIIDMTGKIEEIHGIGVIGLQPIIKPSKQFIYTSFCQLALPQGTMEGQYEFQNLDEVHFVADIPKFILSAPGAVTQVFRSMLH
jgi:ApaG protein